MLPRSMTLPSRYTLMSNSRMMATPSCEDSNCNCSESSRSRNCGSGIMKNSMASGAAMMRVPCQPSQVTEMPNRVSTKPYWLVIRIALSAPTRPSSNPASTIHRPFHEPWQSRRRRRSLHCQIR